MNKSSNQETKQRQPVEGPFDDAIQLLHRQLNQIRSIAPYQIQHEYQKAISLLELARTQAHRQQQDRPTIPFQSHCPLQTSEQRQPLSQGILSTMQFWKQTTLHPSFSPVSSGVAPPPSTQYDTPTTDPSAVRYCSDASFSQQTSITTTYTEKAANNGPNPTTLLPKSSSVSKPTLVLPPSPNSVSLSNGNSPAPSFEYATLVPDPFPVRPNATATDTIGAANMTAPPPESLTPSRFSTPKSNQVLASRDRMTKRGHLKLKRDTQQDPEMAKLSKARRLLNLLLNKIGTTSDKSELDKMMDAIHETNALILPALIHPGPLRQAKVSFFMPMRMKIARTLLLEYEGRFNRTPGAIELLIDRFGTFPRYLW